MFCKWFRKCHRSVGRACFTEGERGRKAQLQGTANSKHPTFNIPNPPESLVLPVQMTPAKHEALSKAQINKALQSRPRLQPRSPELRRSRKARLPQNRYPGGATASATSLAVSASGSRENAARILGEGSSQFVSSLQLFARLASTMTASNSIRRK